MFRRLGALAMVVAAVTGVAAVSARPAPAASAPGAVGVHTETFVDRSRSTPGDVVAGITPAAERRLPTTIFYPARGEATAAAPANDARPRRGRFPVVLFAGGSPGSPDDYAPLLEDWAAAGYVVVAPKFPVSSYAGPDDVAYADLPEQSGDLRFVLRRLLKLDPDRAGIPDLDGRRVAVAGHSFGGQTALSLVAKCCRDSRVGAALVLAGVTDAPDGPALRKVRGPVLFVHSRNDRAVPYQPTRDTCATVSGWKRMLTVEDLRGLRAVAAARHRLGRTGADTTAVHLSGCGSGGGGAR
jgi:dienelactone hydrolase